MISALLLCAHLSAAHAGVSHCAGKTQSTATFQSADGAKGMLAYAPDQSTFEAFESGLPTPAGYTRIVGASARVIVFIHAPTEQAAWWVAAVDQAAEVRLANDRVRGQIADERANPAGVVSLSRLHDLGESLADGLRLQRENEAAYKVGTGLTVPQ